MSSYAQHSCKNPSCLKPNKWFLNDRAFMLHLEKSSSCSKYFWNKVEPDDVARKRCRTSLMPGNITSHCVLSAPRLSCHDVNSKYPSVDLKGSYMNMDRDDNFDSSEGSTCPAVDVLNKKDSNPPFIYSCNQKWTVALLKILEEINAPDTSFKKIITWARNAKNEGYDFYPIGGTSRRKAILQLFPTVSNAEYLLPSVVNVVVPHGPSIDVVAFDFVPQLLSLLQNREIMVQSNLAIDINNPLKMYESPGNVLNEAISGSVYQTAYKRMITDPSKQFFVPIIQWIDRTAVTGNERFSLKPYMFSPAIFTSAFRRSLPAWAYHGFLPKPRGSSAENSMKAQGDNIRNYHKQLSCVLETFTNANARLRNVCLPIGVNGSMVVDIIVCILFIIQDIEEGDRLGGRFGPHSPQIQRQCRTCNVNWDDLENPFVDCIDLLSIQMHEIAQSEDDLLRQQWSQHKLHNAFVNVPFADPIRGIFGAMPVETMHVFRKGMIEKVTFLILDNVTKRTKSSLDKLAVHFHKTHRQTIRSQFPTTDFSNGVTNLTRTSAKERLGLVFLFVILFHYDEGWELLHIILKTRSRSDLADIVELFEAMLCFDAWLSKDAHWCIDDEETSKELLLTSIQSLMEMCRHRIPIGKHGQWNFPKFHELLHIPGDMCRMGSPHNYNAERPEALLKDCAKIPGRRAQKTNDGVQYELKSAQQLTFSIITNIVYSKIWGNEDDEEKDEEEMDEDEMDEEDPDTSLSSVIQESTGRGTTAYISVLSHVEDPSILQCTVTWHSETNVDLLHLPTDLINFIHESVEGNRIRICTELVRGGHTFRCHPNYQSKGPMYDWMKILFEDGSYPCRLCAVIVHEGNSKRSPYQLVVQAADKPTGVKSTLMTEWFFKEDYYLVDTDCIESPCYVITNVSNSPPMKILETLPHNEWASKFTSA